MTNQCGGRLLDVKPPLGRAVGFIMPYLNPNQKAIIGFITAAIVIVSVMGAGTFFLAMGLGYLIDLIWKILK